MDAKDFSNVKICDVLFAVINTGITGIGKYQYSSITKEHSTGKMFHVFLSEHLLSTILIMVGNENNSRRLKDLHFTEESAKKRQNEIRQNEIQDNNSYQSYIQIKQLKIINNDN